MKSQLNNTKLEQTKLEAEFSKLKEQYQQLDITSTKLTNQCEVRRDVSSRLVSSVRQFHSQLSLISSPLLIYVQLTS